MKYGIGIDTGGTFTDSVIVDFDGRKLVAKSKALTTRHDLKEGIQNSLAGLDASLFAEVKLVSLSTTLATNSVVEGKGSRVGLIIAVPDVDSFQRPAKLPAEECAVIGGAQNRKGEEAVPLDLAAARDAILRMKDHVDAFAVSGYFSIYNAAHELSLKQMIAAECAHPVVCGHELSSGVGLVERAVTAALNASLLPVIGELLDAVLHILRDLRIHAPLMVVRGDGSLIAEQTARARPVETVLSGPAASVIGACWLTNLNEAVVADMGGTTTDIGILDGAMPLSSDEGAVVGGWKTRIRSMKMWTAGLGGDSGIGINSAGEIQIGPRRVIPISLASIQYPHLLETLKKLSATRGPLLKELDLDLYTLVRMPNFSVGRYEGLMLAALNGRVLHRAEIEAAAGIPLDLKRFVNLGCVAEVGLTPTDVMHLRGVLDFWDRPACEEALQLYLHKTGLERDALLDLLYEAILSKLKQNIVTKLLMEENVPCSSTEGRELISSLLNLNQRGRVAVQFKMDRPLVAVGAPARAYFPRVTEDLSAELVIPEHAEVANAIGAVTGRVLATARVCVRPLRPVGFAVIAADSQKIFEKHEDATAYAEQLARSNALRRAQECGGKEPEVSLQSQEITAPLASGWGKSIFMELEVTATAVGRPFE